MMSRLFLVLAVTLLAPYRVALAEPAPVEEFARFASYTAVEISPLGDYLAVAAPAGDQTGLAILDIRDYPSIKLVSAFTMPSQEHVRDIVWASDERVIFTTAIQRGSLNRPLMTGRIYAMDADGDNRIMAYGSNIGTDFVFKYHDVLSTLPEESDWILISTYAHDRPRPISMRLNIQNGRRNRGVGSPLENGQLHADTEGSIRFASGYTEDGGTRIAYRESADAEWTELDLPFQDEMNVLGFATDNRHVIVSLRSADRLGLHRLDPVTGELAPMVVDDTVTASLYLKEIEMDGEGREVVGAVFENGIPETRFIDEDGETARLYRLLEQSFPGHSVLVTSSTRDGSKLVVAVTSDRQPTLYFLFDRKARKLVHLLASREWIDPEEMGERRPVRFTARDGMEIHGYLTLPPGKGEKDLPLVVYVHGGPHGVRDGWTWELDSQLLATRGYAVLQVNYRGSGGYGQDFMESGYRKWGTMIQDDITDGVKWTIEQGYADPERICIYGASFGGYSVLQSLVREPDLYRCGFAFVGVYDLNLMFEKGDVPETDFGWNFLERVLGTDAAKRAAQSPVNHVEKIKAPLFIAHGEEDVRAHVEHYYALIEALKAHDIPHESMLVENEGHGFYAMENRIRYYKALLRFMDEHIGE